MEYYLSSLPQLHYGRGITGEHDSYRHLLQGPAAKQLLEMPLGSKLPQLPGSNILLYTTDLCERLYQPSCGFNLGDPHCRLLETQYKSLHDPHLSAYYKRKDILRRLRKGGYITSNNKIVCTLKEFNEYRQYLTSIKLDFEKCYLKEQRLIEEQVAKLEGRNLVPQDPIMELKEDLLEEGKINFQKKVTRGKNRYLDMLNRELEKLEFIAEEQRNLRLTKEEKREHDQYKKKKILRKKLEETGLSKGHLTRTSARREHPQIAGRHIYWTQPLRRRNMSTSAGVVLPPEDKVALPQKDCGLRLRRLKWGHE